MAKPNAAQQIRSLIGGKSVREVLGFIDTMITAARKQLTIGNSFTG
jgi:hypothetical protein